jgi:hypothetical protein
MKTDKNPIARVSFPLDELLESGGIQVQSVISVSAVAQRSLYHEWLEKTHNIEVHAHSQGLEFNLICGRVVALLTWLHVE